MGRTYKDVSAYVKWQNPEAGEILSVKPEQHFDDLGDRVTVWNVKTSNDGNWWVVEGDHTPMNLYPQHAYYFSTDEVYSFHMGLMERMKASQSEYHPEEYVEAMTLGAELAPVLFRRLKNLARQIDTAEELEDFQSIGVQCREILIELGNNIYTPEMAGNDAPPKASDFKKKAELFTRFNLPGQGSNKEYRSIIKKLTDSTWDYANKITHSQSSTFYEASTCVSLTMSLVCTYENLRQKSHDLLAEYQCTSCKSKKLSISSFETSDDVIIHLDLICAECGALTPVELDNPTA